MRIGIRSAISGLVLASIMVSAVGVNLLWWRTARQVSQTLADTINDQIVAAVGDELQSITTEATSALIAVRTLFIQNVLNTSEAEKRKFVFLSQLQAQPTISWVAFGSPDGSFSAATSSAIPPSKCLISPVANRGFRSTDTNLPATTSR